VLRVVSGCFVVCGRNCGSWVGCVDLAITIAASCRGHGTPSNDAFGTRCASRAHRPRCDVPSSVRVDVERLLGGTPALGAIVSCLTIGTQLSAHVCSPLRARRAHALRSDHGQMQNLHATGAYRLKGQRKRPECNAGLTTWHA